MTPRLPVSSFLAAVLIAILAVAPALATSDYVYKKGEYVTVTDGLSPDKKHAIATHGEGEYNDNFRVYLMKEPGHKKIGPLTEIDEYLDTAADAFTARWSPDSRHVAIIHRSDRRVISLYLYRIEKGRAHIVTGPTPLRAAGLAKELPSSADGSDLQEQRMRGFSLTWTGPRTFRLEEDGRIWVNPDSAVALAKFGTITADPAETFAPSPLHQVEYNLTALCEIGAGDTYKVLDLKREELKRYE